MLSVSGAVPRAILAPRPRVDVVGRYLVHGDQTQLVSLDVQGAVVVVVAGRRGDPVHLQAEVDELLERLGERQRGVVIPQFGGKPGADSGPRLLGLGEFQLDLRPEFREGAHRRRLSPACSASGRARRCSWSSGPSSRSSRRPPSRQPAICPCSSSRRRLRIRVRFYCCISRSACLLLNPQLIRNRWAHLRETGEATIRGSYPR